MRRGRAVTWVPPTSEACAAAPPGGRRAEWLVVVPLSWVSCCLGGLAASKFDKTKMMTAACRGPSGCTYRERVKMPPKGPERWHLSSLGSPSLSAHDPGLAPCPWPAPPPQMPAAVSSLSRGNQRCPQGRGDLAQLLAGDWDTGIPSQRTWFKSQLLCFQPRGR